MDSRLTNIIKIYLLLIILPFSIILSDVRFVSNTGSSQFPYTSWETASDSIQKCINISNSGDTIYVANGTYKEQITLKNGLSLLGAGIDSCIIDFTSFTDPAAWTITGADSCLIKGFYIKVSNNFTKGGINIWDNYMVCKNLKMDNCEGRILLGNSNSIIDDCIISNFSNDGIVIIASLVSNYPQIINNLIVGKSNANVIAIHDDFANTTVRNNIIYIDGGFSEGYLGGYSNSTWIYNNLIIGNRFFYGFENHGVPTYEYNNVVIGGSHPDGAAFLVYNPNILKNNIAMNGVRGFQIWQGSPTVMFNNAWKNSKADYTFNPDSTNLSVDPMFVNDTNDFHLQMFSPLIDRGDPSILDQDSTRSDIGLYGGPFGESYKYKDLAPKAPKGLNLTKDSNYVTIKWKKNTEADFNHYNLYRDTIAGFTANSNTLVLSLTDTTYRHIILSGISKYFYKLTSLDNQGNISPLSEELGISITSINDKWQAISQYNLFQNYPNPFNPSTLIPYRLKERGYIKLTIYDIKGEQVAILVNQYQDAGYYEIEFMGTNKDKGKTFVDKIASGIYLYRLDVKNTNNIPVYSDMKKMILLK